MGVSPGYHIWKAQSGHLSLISDGNSVTQSRWVLPSPLYNSYSFLSLHCAGRNFETMQLPVSNQNPHPGFSVLMSLT